MPVAEREPRQDREADAARDHREHDAVVRYVHPRARQPVLAGPPRPRVRRAVLGPVDQRKASEFGHSLRADQVERLAQQVDGGEAGLWVGVLGEGGDREVGPAVRHLARRAAPEFAHDQHPRDDAGVTGREAFERGRQQVDGGAVFRAGGRGRDGRRGLRAHVDAFLGMLRGDHVGKVLVRAAD
jgi:hypothetical protein